MIDHICIGCGSDQDLITASVCGNCCVLAKSILAERNQRIEEQQQAIHLHADARDALSKRVTELELELNRVRCQCAPGQTLEKRPRCSLCQGTGIMPGEHDVKAYEARRAREKQYGKSRYKIKVPQEELED